MWPNPPGWVTLIYVIDEDFLIYVANGDFSDISEADSFL